MKKFRKLAILLSVCIMVSALGSLSVSASYATANSSGASAGTSGTNALARATWDGGLGGSNQDGPRNGSVAASISAPSSATKTMGTAYIGSECVAFDSWSR